MIKNLHFWAAVTAYSIWGTFPLFLKQLSGFPAYTILFYRIQFAATLGISISVIFMRKTLKDEWLLWKERTATTRLKIIGVMTGGGILLSVNWLLYIYVVNTINIQSASFAYMLCPILTAVLGALVLKEKLHAHHRVAIVLGCISCLILAVTEPGNTLFSLTIALSYALYLIIQKHADGINRVVLLSIQMLFSILIISLTLNLAGISTPPHPFLLSMTAIMALVFTLLPLLLNLYSLQGLSSGTVGFLMYINPLLNFIIAFVLFQEKSSSAHLTAYALVLAAIIFFNRDRFR
jgi:chloramphenicol-sensitive protein RarD